MPLIACPDCGRQVSDRAAASPDCGGPIAAAAPAVPSAPPIGAVTIANQKYALPALALPFALLCYFLAWGKAILDAYNSHDDNVDKLFTEEPKAAAGHKAA